MKRAEFEQVTGEFAAFHGEFARFFGRTEARHRSEQYLRGLLVQQTDRRNAENLAEAVGGASARALQRHLSESPWATRPVLDALQGYLAARLNTPEGIFVFDESGFPKKGTKSVGVTRQYCGTLGKVGNCQLGVFLGYVSQRGHALVDANLFLPREWIEDDARRLEAGIPTEVTYQTKAELALGMLRHAKHLGKLQGDWVTADEDYGKSPALRDALDAEGWHYVLEVAGCTTVFPHPAHVAVPTWSGAGKKPTKPRLVDGEAPAQPMEGWAAHLDEARWQTITVGEGAQGPRTYQFVAQRGWESREGLPGRACWLVARRNLDGSELKFYLSNAPADTPLATLGYVGAQRWPIETDFQTGKGETGLDEYEVRSWMGWHHHITLALLAGAFLLNIQQEWGKKSARSHPTPSQPGAPGNPSSPLLDRSRTLVLAP